MIYQGPRWLQCRRRPCRFTYQCPRHPRSSSTGHLAKIYYKNIAVALNFSVALAKIKTKIYRIGFKKYDN